MQKIFNRWGGFIFWPALLGLLFLLSFTGLIFIKPLILGVILALQGFAVAQICRLDFKEGLVAQLVLNLFLGLTATLLISFIAMFIGLTINQLTITFIIITVLLYHISIVLAGLHKEETNELNWKKLFKLEDLTGLIMFLGLIILTIAIYFNGSHFQGGDPAFHLSLMRKAFDGAPLTLNNLNYVKDLQNLAYGFPVWHVFVALYAKIAQLDLFIAYKTITVFLSIFAVLIWLFLARQIFPNKFLAYLVAFFLMVFNFYYPFSVLALPDVLSQYIFLPLALALALKYIFDEKQKIALAVWLSVLLIELLAIHATQYFYYLLIMFIFALTQLIFNWDKQTQWVFVKRFLAAVGLNWLGMLPFVIFLELKGKALLSALQGFMETNLRTLRYNEFGKFYILAKLAYLFTPLLLIFRRQKRFLFLFAVLVTTPLVYFTPIKTLLMRVLGYIFVNRIYANTNWYFVLWAVLVGILLIIVASLLIRLPKIIKWLYLLITTGLLFVLINLQLKNNSVLAFYKSVFLSDNLAHFIGKYYWLFWAVGLLLVLIIWLISRKNPKINSGIKLIEPNPLFVLPTLLIIAFLLFTPRLQVFFDAYNQKKIADKQFSQTSTANLAGGVDTVEFIRNNIPGKSVFVTNGRGVYLTMLTDQFLPAYPHSADEKRLELIYSAKQTQAERLQLIKAKKIQYVVLTNKTPDPFFSQNQSIFTEIFHGQSYIYSVNLKNIF